MTMKKNIFIYIFLIYVCSIGVSNGQATPILFKNNGHLYQFVQIVSGTSFADGASKITTYVNATGGALQGYPAVIDNFDEFQFIQSSMYSSFPTEANVKVYISGTVKNNNNIIYNTGTENNDVMYSLTTSQCYTVCPWAVGQPSITATKNTITLIKGSANIFTFAMDVWQNSPTLTYMLVEYGGLTEPHLIAPTTAGGLAVFNNFRMNEQNEDWSSLSNIRLSLTIGSSTTTPALTVNPVSKSIIFTMPAGINAYTITLTDVGTPAHPTYSYNGLYKIPFVNVVYASEYTAGSVITLSGDNFGTEVGSLTVKYGSTQLPCDQVKIVQAHKAISCVLSASTNVVSITLLPISVQIGPLGANYIYNNPRVAFYDASTVSISSVAADITESFTRVQAFIKGLGLVEAHKPYTGVVWNTNMANTLLNSVNMGISIVFQGISDILNTANLYIDNNAGPNDGQIAMTSKTTCNNTLIVCPNAGTINPITKYMGFNRGAGSFSINAGIATSVWGYMISWGYKPTEAAPVTYLLDTAGGNIDYIVGSGSVGFQYSTRKFTFSGVTTTNTGITLINSTAMRIPIPAGTGLNNALSVSIESFTFTNAKISYKPPMITLIDPEGLSIEGGNLTISGYQFGNTIAELSMTTLGLACTPIKFITNHTKFVCNLAEGGSGIMLFNLNVDSQPTYYSYNFAPPVIQSIVQDQFNPLMITVYGTNFGVKQSISISPSTWSVYEVNSLGGANQFMVLLTPEENAKNQDIKMKTNDIYSNSMFFAFKPTISQVTNASPNQATNVTLTGTFFNTLMANGSSTNFTVMINETIPCINVVSQSSDQFYCTSPVLYGVHSIVVTIDGKSSNSFALISPTPTVSIVAQNDTQLTIIGQNFGQDINMIQVKIGSQQFTPVSVDPTYVIVNVTLPAYSGNLTVSVASVNSNSYPFKFTPTIKSVSTLDTSGGYLYINGIYFANIDAYGSTLTVSVLVGSTPCTLLEYNANFTQIKCKLNPGVGSYTIIVTIDNVLSNTPTWSYNIANISSITQYNDEFSIVGTNFYDNGATYVRFNGVDNPPSYVSFNLIKVSLNYFYKNADMYIYNYVGKQLSLPKPFALTPIINNVPTIPTNGGSFIIPGKYLWNVDHNGKSINSQVLANNKPCLNPKFNGDSVECVITNGTGVNKVFNVTMGSISGSYNFSYLPPTITSLTLTNSTILSIVGNNFGNDGSVITPPNGLSLISVNHTLIIFNFDSQVLSQTIEFSVDGQVVSHLFTPTPIVSSFTRINALGGDILFIGQFLNSKRKDGSSTDMIILLGSNVCTFKSTNQDNTELVCSVASKSIFDEYIDLSIDDQFARIDETYSSLPPVVQSVTSPTPNSNETITIRGQYFVSPVTVSIDTVDCINPQVVDSDTITCDFDGSVESQRYGLKVTVFNDEIPGYGNVFLYNLFNCTDKCGSNGKCNSGYCDCNDGFIGETCSVQISNQCTPAVKISPNGVQYQFTDRFYSSASLVAIQELDDQPEVIKEVFLNQWTSIGSSQQKATLPEGGSIIITTSKFDNADTVEYAGEVFSVEKSTIKHTVKLSDWKFASQDNTIRLIYEFVTPSEFEVDNVTYTSTVIPSVAYNSSFTPSLTIDTPVSTLFSQFSNRAYMDDSVNRIQVININTTTINNIQTIRYGVVITNFDSYVSFDPTFISQFKSNQCPKTTPTPTSTQTPKPTDEVSSTIKLIPCSILLLVLLLISILF